MPDTILAMISAVWLGVMTSISPCPLATNIAAISFMGRQIQRPTMVGLSGLLYTLGRAAAYLIISLVILKSVLSAHALKPFLEDHMTMALGPILVVTGLLLVGVFSFSLPGVSWLQRLGESLADWNILGAFPLGFLFALSFCPVTLALYFGGLMPLALEHQSSIIIPTAYGVGTALPVVVFALLVAFGARSIGKVFTSITRFEKWMRIGTGVLFILIGIYFLVRYTFGVI